MGRAKRLAKVLKQVRKDRPKGQESGGHQLTTFWGVRGTLPTPGLAYVRYGGQTSCVEIRSLGPNPCSIICDGGSGIAKYGDAAISRGDRVFHILLSHMHYDHVMGLTKFAPFFRPDTEVHIYGLAKGGFGLRELFARFFSFPFFPLEFKDLPSLPNLHFHEINGIEGVLIEGCRVEFQLLNHPQAAVGFRVWSAAGDTSVVYATDHEHGTGTDEALVDFSKDATLFLYDSTFSQEAYPKFGGWGHSTAVMGAKFAAMAKAKWYGLFHHDPDAPDALLEAKLLPEAQKILPQSFLAREGDTLHMASLRDVGLEKARTEGDFFRFSQKNHDLKTG